MVLVEFLSLSRVLGGQGVWLPLGSSSWEHLISTSSLLRE